MNILPEFDVDKVTQLAFAPDCSTNVSEEDILQNVASSIRRGLPQVQPHDVNTFTALLVCGGPSLRETERELVDEVWNGHKVVAVNGAYQWCIDHNLKPSAAVMINAREFNARFFNTPVDGCKYFLASQCHPKTFNVCSDRDTYIWHAIGSGSEAEIDLLREYYFEKQVEKTSRQFAGHAWPITLGTTIGIRAISLLRMLGFVRIDVFGLDSCWLNEAHHAYEQPENADKRMSAWLRPGDRSAHHFWCAPWHLQQAEDFKELIRERGDQFQLSVRGNGLIATMLRTGAQIEQEE